MKTQKLTLISMFTAIALTIFVVEAYLPPLAPIPGIKLGLANIITLILLATLGGKEAFTVMFLRIALGSIFTGGVMSCMYSFSGGIVCFVLMYFALKILKIDKLPVVSVIGAIGHNVGQIFVAVIITKSLQIIWYLPILMISGFITGAFTGMLAKCTLKHSDWFIKKKILDIKG